jgi:two-component system LytT family sensor kinase
MQKSLLFLILFFSSILCQAQKTKINLDDINPIIKYDSHGDSIRKYFTNTYYSHEKSGLLIIAFYSNKLEVGHNRVEKVAPQIKDYLNRKTGSFEVSINSYAGRYAIPILDTSGIIITVNGINPENAHEYEFRVLENKTKVVVPWTQPKLFPKAYSMSRIADPTKDDEVTAYLGQFKEDYGKALTFEVRKKTIPASMKTSISAYWLKWRPKVAGVFTFSELPDFLTIFHRQWGSQILENSYNGNWSKDTTLLKLKNDFRYDENNLIFYLEDIIGSKSITQYNLINGNDSTGWKSNDFNFNLVWLKNLTPGNYNLKIHYSIQPEQITSYTFTIHAAWYQTLWAKIGLTLLIFSAVGFIILLWRSRKQSEKLKTQSTSKRMIQTELKSIRSQFNPHFVFNALSSIQGLIIKNDPENASKYLLEFSNLMRDSLKASDKEFVSISTEIKILENYLKLEKLRFGFNYEIETSPSIDINAVEIPSLFLQPLVENAVKHGISALQEKGRLNVTFKREADDLIIIVKDNGKGFKEESGTSGFGLKLTRERINLLNQTLNEQQIEFSVAHIQDQTHVFIHFKNWLL